MSGTLAKALKCAAFFLAHFIVCAFATGCSTAAFRYSVEKNHAFIEPDGKVLKVDLYRPERKTQAPAVIVVHGGSWTSRSGDMESVCIKLAKEGFVAFNVTYRLAPENLYPKAVNDVKDAFTWVRTHAKEFNVDPDQLFVWGYSAGAHLALLAGLDPATQVRGIVGGGAPTDLTKFPDSPISTKFLGKTYNEDPKLWAEASPVNHVTPQSPPIFLYHGKWDDIVEPKHVEWMAQKAKENKIRFESYLVPLQGHIAVYLLSTESDRRSIDFLKSLVKHQ